jgi:hypothetical protein
LEKLSMLVADGEHPTSDAATASPRDKPVNLISTT